MLGTAQVQEAGARPEEPVVQQLQHRVPPTRPRAVVLAVAGYLVLSVLSFRPLLPWSGTSLPTGTTGDPVQMVWFLRWAPWAIGHLQNPFFTDLIGFPHGVNLAANTPALPLGILASPITLLGGPVASWNLLMRLSLACSALAMCLVVRRWTRWWPAAFLAGLLYGFGPYMQFEAGAHLNLVFLPLPPILLLLLDDLLVTQRRPTVRTGFLLGLVLVLQFLINAEILADSVILAVVGLIGIGLRYHRQVVDHLVTAWRGLAAVLVTAIVLGVYPVWALLDGARHVTGHTQPSWYVVGHPGDLLGPVLQSIPRTTIGPPNAPGQPPIVLHWSNASGYLGIPLVLVLLVLIVAWRREGAVRLGAFLGFVAFVLSLGARLTVDGHTTWFPLPGAIFSHIPALWNILPVRFTALIGLCAALVLAVGLDRTKDWIAAALRRGGGALRRGGAHHAAAGRSRARLTPRSLALVVGTSVVVVTLAVMVPLLVQFPMVHEQSLPAFDTGAFIAQRTPASGVVLPVPQVTVADDTPMLWQAQAGMPFKLAGGYAIVPGPAGSNEAAAKAPLPPTLEALNASLTGPQETLARHGNPAAVQRLEAACQAVPGALRHLGVDTTVAYRSPDVDYAYVVRVLTAALGPPAARSTVGGLSLWTRGHGWPTARDCSTLASAGALFRREDGSGGMSVVSVA